MDFPQIFLLFPIASEKSWLVLHIRRWHPVCVWLSGEVLCHNVKYLLKYYLHSELFPAPPCFLHTASIGCEQLISNMYLFNVKALQLLMLVPFKLHIQVNCQEQYRIIKVLALGFRCVNHILLLKVIHQRENQKVVYKRKRRGKINQWALHKHKVLKCSQKETTQWCTEQHTYKGLTKKINNRSR